MTDAAWIDGVAARVLGQTTGTSDPEAVLQAATAAFADLVGADTVRLWADVGGGSLELVASAGDEGDALAGRTFFVSSERGRLAETLRARRPQRRAPLGDSEMLRAWQAMVPGLRRRPVAGLFLPLCLAERSFALLYGVRYEDRPFSSSDERLGDRLARRIEPTLAWSLQARTARRVSAATQDFLRITTHELRRPLTVLRGYVEMLRTADDQEAPVFRERIERASDRMATLLSEITEMVMLEDPQRPLDIAAHRLGDLAARIEWPARDEAEQRGCELVAQVGDPDAIVNCDRHHIEHAVANLLSNAFRHTGGHRRVWLSIGTSGARTWRIAVRDEGDGVNPGEVERIFDKYYRSEQTRQSGWEGSGLGLHYVRLVAERHGGRVSADNLETGGAEFTLVLPVAAGVAPWSI